MSKRVLITGITGQDGAFLAKELLEKGHEVFGAVRRSSHRSTERLDYLGITEKVKFVDFELLELGNVMRVIKSVKPDYVYNLGSQSFVGSSFEEPTYTAEVTGLGALRILEALRSISPDTRYYQASSSEMFGLADGKPLNEKSEFHPRSPYGCAKVFAHHATVNYRESYKMFCCSGILFNHESELRGFEFVTRRISVAVAKIELGRQKELKLGNTAAKRDWGYAPEFVRGMIAMLEADKADDYVLATGETHSVQEFVEAAFGHADMDWKKFVKIDESLFRPADVPVLIGDASKAQKQLRWKPKTKFKDLVKIMVDSDIRRLKDNPGSF